ncbi:MAG: hypothetical protein NUV56_00115, partial [Candidatus Uhrbacteria bacterium]|nr:hypothetical protein [Candidatus Uhrbacteria bacterium]
VVYQAGTRLVKIPSVATVFAVESDGVLRAIQDEEQAVELFGNDWAKRVDDVPEGFWPSFSQGEALGEDELPEGMLLENEDGLFRVNNEGEAEEIDTVLDPDQEDVLQEHARDIDEVERLTGVALALIRVDAEHAAEILAEVLEKLKTVDVGDEDKIDVDDIDELEDEDDAKEDAEDAIKDAEDEIERAGEEITEATSEGDDVSEAQVKLDEANAKLAEAEILLASGDWDAAEEQADEAKHDAMHARGKYIRSLDEDEDGVEDDEEDEDESTDDDLEDDDAEDVSEDSEDSLDDNEDDSVEDTDEDESDDTTDDDNSGDEDDDDTSVNT